MYDSAMCKIGSDGMSCVTLDGPDDAEGGISWYHSKS